MRRFELTGERPIDRFASVGARVRRLAAEAHVVVIEISGGGHVGRHPAAAQQLFAVVRGAGWVTGSDGSRQEIRAGDAVVWDEGEEHESGSAEGMIAIVLEADSLDA